MENNAPKAPRQRPPDRRTDDEETPSRLHCQRFHRSDRSREQSRLRGHACGPSTRRDARHTGMRGVRIRRLNYRLMKTIRWGMIGCGDVAEIKSGPGLYKASHSKLVAVMRRNGLLAADFARRHGVPRWHDDADAIIEAPDIDAVYIATLNDTHPDYGLR